MLVHMQTEILKENQKHMKIRTESVFLTALWFQYSKIFVDLLRDSNFSCEGTCRPYLQLIPSFH